MKDKTLKAKFVKLNEKTRVLLNRARGMLLSTDPKITKLTDDMVLRIALLNYLGVK